jgi:hypothetical protein
MNLSKNLTLAEVTNSDTAKRLGINNQPTPEHLENLKLLAEKVFQPIREHFGKPIHVSSGYRSKALNKKTPGSSSTSQHCSGEAIDLDQQTMSTGITNKMVFDYIKDNLSFDQLIAEYPDKSDLSWVHVSYSKKKNRKQILISKRVNGKVTYKHYNNDSDLI